MAQYTINFSSNASDVIRELNSVIGAVAKVEKAGSRVSLSIDTSRLSRGIAITFKDIDKQINNMQRKLSRLQIGSGAFRSTQAAIGFREGQRERGELIGQSLRLRGQAQSFESGSLVNLSKELQALQIEASQVRPNSQEWASFQQQIGRIRGELQKADQAAEAIQLRENLGAFRPGSLDQLQARLRLLKIEANAIAPDTSRWKEVNAEIQKTERGIQRISKKPLSAGQRAGAAGGAFLYGGGMGGGVGSALGGVAGGLAGGVPGAFAGAAIGQVVDNLGQSLAAITSQASKVQQLQRGLALASIDAKDFAEAQAAVADTSAKLFIPIEQVTKSFAQLRVNTKQYGMSVEETKRILEGTILAVSAVGGSAEDVDGAMRAVVQILSKGSVQAEELRGQLGERFPGAVVKFAQANKLSFEELQKGLEQGQIGIREFVAFAEKNYEDYAEFSQKLATAPEFAGRRLQVALEQLAVEFGSLFGGIGANIQDNLTEAIGFITKFIKDNKTYLQQFINDWGSIISPIANVIGELLKVIMKFSIEVGKVFQNLFSLIRQSLGMASIGEARARLDRARAATAGRTKPAGNVRGGGAFVELSQAEQAYRDLGGDAAFNRANQPTVSDLTFGGLGAGISIDREGSAKEAKEKKLKQFYEDQSRLLKSTLDLRIKDLEAQRLAGELSEYDFQRQKAILELDFQKKIISEGLSVALRQLADENLSATDKELKASQLKKEAALDLAKAEKDSALDIEKARQALTEIFDSEQNKLELEKQKAMIDAVSSGMRELNPDMQAYFDIREKLAGISATDAALIKTEIDAYRAQREEIYQNARALEFLNEQLDLQNRLQLAGILDPRVELRARLRQEKPGFTLDQIEEIATLQETITEVEKGRDRLRSIASSIGDAFGTAFKGIITGTSSVREALAGMFQSIADSFADMIAQMISEWLKAQLIKGFMSLFPGFGGAAGGIGSAASNLNQYAPLVPMANGGVLSGGFRAFANGGIVTGPTLGLVGEGRYNEAVIPLPDGKSVPVDLGGGAGSQITSNIVVNVSSDGKASSSGADSVGLGRKIEGAVKQVIVEELRPGGVLAGRR
jgi:tape measure domain-containing protein